MFCLKPGTFASVGLYNKGFIYLDVPISDDSCIAGKYVLIFFKVLRMTTGFSALHITLLKLDTNDSRIFDVRSFY